MARRRQFGVAFKAKVAIEVLKGEKTLNEIALMYEVHPNQVGQWKKEALELLPSAMTAQFSNSNGDITRSLASVHSRSRMTKPLTSS
jgi:transposase